MKTLWMGGLLGLVLVTANARADVKIKPAKDHVDFLIGDELVTRYHTAKFTRPIFWPLKAPGDIAITRAWPMEPAPKGGTTDHPHQKSCWFTWGEVIPEGIPLKEKKIIVKGKEKMVTPKYVDFWAEGDGQIICTQVDEPRTEKNKGRLATKNEWRMADGTKIMDETRVLYFYDFGKARLIVFDVTLNATVCPITFADTKEGAMGVRVHDDIMASKIGKGKIQNAEGKINEKECWGQVSAWCDYSGSLEGKTVGVAILSDPKNPHPACWHTRGYGLHAANPFGRGKAFPSMKGRADVVRLAKGESIHFRYGVLVHEGDAVSGQVAEYFQRFVKLGESEKTK